MIIACGEALIDFLPRTDNEGAAVYRPFGGGSVFNVAIALGRLGAPTGFFSGLSTDFFGAMLKQSLQDSHVDVSFCKITDRPSTLAFVSLSDGQARYAFFDEGTAGRMLAAADLPALPQTVTALHFGSISLTAEPCGTAYETFMQNEKSVARHFTRSKHPAEPDQESRRVSRAHPPPRRYGRRRQAQPGRSRLD